MNRWNGKRFSIYDKEEKQVLGLLNNLGEQTNFNTDEVERLTISDNKKVSHQEMQDIYKIDKDANFTGSWYGIKKPTASQEGLQATVDKIVEKDIPNINSQLEQIIQYEVYSENDLDFAITNKFENVILKNNILLTSSKVLDKFNFKINLNGFTIKLDNNYTDSFIFEIGKNEYLDFYNKYSKWIYNGLFDMNNKNASILKHTFSWDLKCYELRVINAMKGFIEYDVTEEQTTRGAESYFNNISLIGSEDIPINSLAFDMWIGDSMISNLYSQYFTYGLKTRVGGLITKDCHFWGLPNSSGKQNHIMKIGVINENYFNNFINIIVDTPERYDISQPSSYENGGIAFYDKMSSNNRYINCDILEHPNSEDESIIAFYLEKPVTVDDKYHGGSFVIDSCYSRNPSKLKCGVFYEGKTRNINIINTDFTINRKGRTRGANRFTANTTVYKYDTEMKNTDKVDDFSLCNGINEFQFINDDYGINWLIRDSSGNAKWIRLNEKFNATYNSVQLQELANELKKRQAIVGQANNMNNIEVTKYSGNIELGNPGRYDRVLWITGLQAFINLRTGVVETN